MTIARSFSPLSCATTGNAVVLYDREVSVQCFPMHRTRACCTHQLQIIYFPASRCRCLTVWRTFSYGTVSRTFRRVHLHDRVCPLPQRRTARPLRRRPGALPLVRLLRAIAPTRPDDDVLLACLLRAQTHSIVGCSGQYREHVFACMLPLSRLAPQLPASLWREAIWPLL